MTCRRDRRAVLIALALLLAGCSGDGGADVGARDALDDAVFARLLDDAGAAMAEGNLAVAGRKLDAARARQPDDPALWVAIARLRFRGGEHLTAIEAADRALALGPDHAPALLMRALMVRDAHGFAASELWFEAALAADPANPDAWAEYAAALGDSGQASGMLSAVRELAEVAPGDPRVFYLQAVLAARAGEHALARSLLERSRMAVRGVPAAVLLDAVISLEEGNPDSAVAALEPLAQRQPANTRLRELLARALLASGREAELIDRFGRDAQAAETSPYLALLVGRAHERLGDRVAAAPLLARAYRGARKGLAVLAVRDGLPQPTADARRAALAGSWNAGRKDAERLRRRFPASADVASLAGDAILGAGDPQAALAAYALATRVKRPWSLTRRAVLAYRSSRDEAAATTLLARHVAGEPDGISGLIALAEVEGQRGEWGRTALLLDHAGALGGGNDPALLALRLQAARALGVPADAQRFAGLLADVRPRRLAQR